VGNPTKIVREDGSATYYAYDHIYQLTGELQVDDEEAVEYAFEYDYDGAHNRTVKVVDGVPTYYTYNAANELLTETTEGETTYSHYDGCGNTVAKQEPSGTTYYRYNTENLTTRIDFAAGGNSYYQYDADSKRVSQRTADGFRQFVYQGPDMLKLQLERDESEETVAHYTMGSGLEAMRRSEASSFYHYNHLGTTLALTGADEAVSDTYRLDAWGVLLASTGSTVNPHAYVGQQRYYRMPNAGMYHLGFRDYAQGLGRFMTVDPVRYGVNWIAYVGNRPAATADARGLQGDPRDGDYRPPPGGWPDFGIDLPPIYLPPWEPRPPDYPIVGIGPHQPAWCSGAIYKKLYEFYFGGKKSTWDKHQHCVLGCTAKRFCGGYSTEVLAHFKELIDYWRKYLQPGWSPISPGVGWDPDDIVATNAGADCSLGEWKTHIIRIPITRYPILDHCLKTRWREIWWEKEFQIWEPMSCEACCSKMGFTPQKPPGGSMPPGFENPPLIRYPIY